MARQDVASLVGRRPRRDLAAPCVTAVDRRTGFRYRRWVSWRAVPTTAAVVATLLSTATTARAATVTFTPSTGAELVTAANTITNAGRADATYRGVIKLSAKEYVISSTVVLSTKALATIEGPEDGRATITTSGTSEPFTLLRLSSETPSSDAGLRNVDLTLKRNATTAMASGVVVADLQRGAVVRDSTVTVPATASKATAVRLSAGLGITPVTTPAPAVARSVVVESSATEAPGVRLTNGGQLLDSTVRGGAAPVELASDTTGSDLGPAVVDASTIVTRGTSAAVPAVRVRGGAVRFRPVLWSTSIDGTATDAGRIVDVLGPTSAAGALEPSLGQLSLRGAEASVGLWVRPGVGSNPLPVAARGILSLGSKIAVDCTGSTTAATTVTVTGVYRTGSKVQGNGCSLPESGLRTGPLAWRDEAGGDLRPVWDSPLVDAVPDFGVPQPAGEHDLAGGQRFVTIASGSTPGDIGALEYQLTPPENVAADFIPLGNRGLTVLRGEGTDPDPLEEASLSFLWTLPNGVEVKGPVALQRFETTDPQVVRLTVTDVTGVTVRRTITVTPVIRLDEPPTDSNDPDDPVVPPTSPTTPDPDTDPGPVTPIFGGIGQGLLGGGAQGGSGPTKPYIDPALKQDYPPILKNVRATKRRVLTSRQKQPEYASARRGEAEIIIETWRRSEMTLEVTRILEGTGIEAGLPLATATLRPFKGRKTLRIGAKVGKRKLKPGLYQMTIAASPAPGAVSERKPFFVRVIRD